MPFPIGARVLVDNLRQAIVRAEFTYGSFFRPWPHYKLDFVDGDKNVAVHTSRVSVIRRKVKR